MNDFLRCLPFDLKPFFLAALIFIWEIFKRIRIIVFFSLLVYLEFLVLNFCNFNYNLKESIIERSIIEYEKDKNSQIKEKDENKMEEEESLSSSYNRDSADL